jgi:hypothetical protein
VFLAASGHAQPPQKTLIMEMNTPLDGVIGISLAPMREALALLSQ